MTVSFADAIATLQSMFSGVDKEVIAYVLESNGGHMEKTVDDLLVMSGQQADPAAATRPAATGGNGGDGYALPDDFLSLPGQQQPQQQQQHQLYPASGYQDERTGMRGRPDEVDQIQADAEFARMVQDQMFMEQMQNHPEWRQQQQQQSQQPYSPQQQQRRAGTASAGTVNSAGSPPAGGDSMEQFRQKWNALSDAAKVRFNSFFSSTANNTATGRRDGSINSARYTSLPGDDNDDDDSDVIAFNGNNGDMNRRNNNPSDLNETELQDTRTFKSASAASGGGGGGKKMD